MAIALLFLLILALTPLSQSAVFTSIDCGSDSDSYTDENSIKWIGDGGLISEGEPRAVRADSEHRSLRTLRVFTGPRKKYCYAIPAEKGGKVLIRTTFYYGNYDGKSSPPSFALFADGNVWEQRVSFASVDQVVPYEAIYVPKGDYISVCVARTNPGQFPIISAIEVRSVGSDMYARANSTHALLTKLRIPFGANKDIRYPDDPYDRLWISEPVNPGLFKLTNEAPSNIDVSTAQDNPPRAALQNAVSSAFTSGVIGRRLGLPPSPAVPVCVNLYFSEAAPLGLGEKRSMWFIIDGEAVSDTPIVPSYGSVTQFTAITTSSKNLLALAAATDSTLPPSINALEVFIIGRLTEGTNSQDLEGLASLQKEFSVLQGWTGDPCLPATFTWDWLDCSSDARPRVTALYLNGFGLKGSIPDFSSLDALEFIDMSSNSLTGSVPVFVGNLPNLKELNLADNMLTGSIPASLKNGNLKLDLSGNPVTCSSGKPCTSRKNEYTNSNLIGGSAERKRGKLTIIYGAIASSFFALL